MKEACCVDFLKCINDFQRGRPKFPLCHQRIGVVLHELDEAVVAPLHHHVNVLLVLKVFHQLDHVCLLKSELLHWKVQYQLRDVLRWLIELVFLYDFNSNLHSGSKLNRLYNNLVGCLLEEIALHRFVLRDLLVEPLFIQDQHESALSCFCALKVNGAFLTDIIFELERVAHVLLISINGLVKWIDIWTLLSLLSKLDLNRYFSGRVHILKF